MSLMRLNSICANVSCRAWAMWRFPRAFTAGIRLLGLNAMALKINPDVLAFDVQLQVKSKVAQTELGAMKKTRADKAAKSFLKTSDALI